MKGVEALKEFVGMNDYIVNENWNLCNRPTYKMKNGVYKSKVMNREPEVDYIST